ncbi:MAG: NAD(P)-dependent oxidoreductase [Planctomycetota bacterium]
MKFTVLGSTGFIGSHVAALARSQGHDVYCPVRGESLDHQNLGHVIYAIGITADFRQRPHETITAHVTKLQEVLTQSTFESLVYLSSTRVYARCSGNGRPVGLHAVNESTPVPVVSSDFSDLYNLSKLMGESIALSHAPRVRVARLSNVVGPDFTSDNFLTSVLRDCVQKGRVLLRSSLASVKDYVSVKDVAEILLRIGTDGRSPIYNVASGCQTTNAEIITELTRLTGAEISVTPEAPTLGFPPIDISLLSAEFGFAPRCMEEILPDLVAQSWKYYSLPTCREAA